MIWDPEQLRDDFLKVARVAEICIQSEDIYIKLQKMPHSRPSLPERKVAVYVFSDTERVLKVGKAGPQSGHRYRYQHYLVRGAESTLANSLQSDPCASQRHNLDQNNVGEWIRNHTDRANYLLDDDYNGPTLDLLEAFVQCRLKPIYEGR